MGIDFEHCRVQAVAAGHERFVDAGRQVAQGGRQPRFGPGADQVAAQPRACRKRRRGVEAQALFQVGGLRAQHGGHHQVLVVLGDEPGRRREQAAQEQTECGESQGDAAAEWQGAGQVDDLAGN
ncbi:MAG TPA: hypothetical protein PKZ76_01435 [Xanthomonadaceae bacterium]|nr:hypothetical protein [Xanthomonadaceae bacterium]